VRTGFCTLALFALPFAGAGCSDLKPLVPPDSEPRADAAVVADGGSGFDAGPTGTVTVESVADDRNRPGAYSTQGYKPFRTGIALFGDELYWVESGTQPGLYALSVTSPSNVRKVAPLTQPTSFFATTDTLYVGDRTQLKMLRPPATALAVIASVQDDIVTLTANANFALFTQGAANAISRWSEGTTAPFINSNGVPVAMAVTGSKVIWGGVDISGLNGVLQGIGLNKSGFLEYKRFSSGFASIAASDVYAYYAHQSPPVVHRIALASGADEKIGEAGSIVPEFSVTATHAYWVERGSAPNYENGRIMRVAHDSTQPEVLAVSIPSPIAIIAQGNTAYVASAGQKTKAYANGKILKVTVTP
jgi:hypothetical protein